MAEFLDTFRRVISPNASILTGSRYRASHGRATYFVSCPESQVSHDYKQRTSVSHTHSHLWNRSSSLAEGNETTFLLQKANSSKDFQIWLQQMHSRTTGRSEFPAVILAISYFTYNVFTPCSKTQHNLTEVLLCRSEVMCLVVLLFSLPPQTADLIEAEDFCWS